VENRGPEALGQRDGNTYQCQSHYSKTIKGIPETKKHCLQAWYVLKPTTKQDWLWEVVGLLGLITAISLGFY